MESRNGQKHWFGSNTLSPFDPGTAKWPKAFVLKQKVVALIKYQDFLKETIFSSAGVSRKAEVVSVSPVVRPLLLLLDRFLVPFLRKQKKKEKKEMNIDDIVDLLL